MTCPIDWIEHLDLYGESHFDDLKPDQAVELEKRMYEAALLSAKEGYRRLSAMKVPASRRPDYYAEMLKDDRQMTKIREKLVVAQQRIEAVETRKNKQAQRKFSKQLKAAKIEKRKLEKANEKASSKPVFKGSEKINSETPARPGKNPKQRSGKNQKNAKASRFHHKSVKPSIGKGRKQSGNSKQSQKFSKKGRR